LTPGGFLNTVFPMSLAQLKDEAAHLQPSEQRELIAFLVARQTEQDEDFKRTLAEKIDNTDQSNWVEFDELQKRYTD
jgi:hypothetical protein